MNTTGDILIEPSMHNILIIDDNPNNLSLLENFLKEHGFTTMVATKGELGLQCAEYARPDLILLDILLPGIDGFETCRRLKANDSTRSIPVIFMTALTGTEDKVKGFEVGGEDYITKPLHTREVLARVMTHLRIHELTQNLQQRTEQLQDQTTKLQQTNQALTESLGTLQLAQDQLVQSEKTAALGRLVAGIAHEINTPVGIGVTAASYLDEVTQELEEQYEHGTMTRSDLEVYLKNAKTSARMILENLRRAAEQIQSFKLIAVDQNSQEKRKFNLRDYLNDILLGLHPKLDKSSHHVTVYCDDDLELESHPGAFSQIISNLVLNSLIHGFESKAQGTMTIEALRDQDILQIRFHDDGCGMTPEIRSKIFEPFFTTKRGKGGTGLGLHLVHNLVTQQLDGHIECESLPGQGTTFLIRIPI